MAVDAEIGSEENSDEGEDGARVMSKGFEMEAIIKDSYKAIVA